MRIVPILVALTLLVWGTHTHALQYAGASNRSPDLTMMGDEKLYHNLKRNTTRTIRWRARNLNNAFWFMRQRAKKFLSGSRLSVSFCEALFLTKKADDLATEYAELQLVFPELAPEAEQWKMQVRGVKLLVSHFATLTKCTK